MTRIAIYDMDKTITRAPTWTPFLLHAASRIAPWRLALLPIAGIATIGYAAGLLDRARLKELTQRLLIGSTVAPGAIAGPVASFAARIVARGCHANAIARIAADRHAGHRLVLATASFDFYAGAIGDALGFDDVIGTQSMHDAYHRLMARIDGANCYGPAKLDRIEAWLAGQGIARAGAQIRFYSDHVSDAAVLGWVDEAFAVNPHAPLRALALEQGWTVLDWR